MQTGTTNGGITYEEFYQMSPEERRNRNKEIATAYLNQGPSISNYYNAAKAYFGGYNPENPYILGGAPDFLPGRAGGNIGKIVGQLKKLPIGKRGAIRTIKGKKVNILDKKVQWAKDADLRKNMDLDYNSKWAGRIDYSE